MQPHHYLKVFVWGGGVCAIGSWQLECSTFTYGYVVQLS